MRRKKLAEQDIQAMRHRSLQTHVVSLMSKHDSEIERHEETKADLDAERAAREKAEADNVELRDGLASALLANARLQTDVDAVLSDALTLARALRHSMRGGARWSQESIKIIGAGLEVAEALIKQHGGEDG